MATTIAGVLAVLAPAVGPCVGGWVTETYDWPWLFLINLGTGIIAISVSAWSLPRQTTDLGLLRNLDYAALALMATALKCLEIASKEAPQQGWRSFPVVALFETTAQRMVSDIRWSVLARGANAAEHHLTQLRE